MSDSKSISQVLKLSPTLVDAMKTEAMACAKLAKQEGLSKEDFATIVSEIVVEVWQEDNDEDNSSGSESGPVQSPEG